MNVSHSSQASVDVPAGASHRILLVTVLLSVVVVPTSISGTALALPNIGADLNASLASLQWVVNAFNLCFACFTLAWGALADVVGRKHAFTMGAAIYAMASAGSALAPTIGMLDVGRGLAGVGAGAIFSCGSAMLSAAFDGPARTRAFALFGTFAGIGVAAGPTISGLLIEVTGWRGIFALHATILTLSVIGALILPREDKPAHGATIDVGGMLLFVGALGLLMVGIVKGADLGWLDPSVYSLFTAAILVFLLFVMVERRKRHPMLDLSILKNHYFLALCLIPVAASFGFVTLLTYFPTYLTVVMGQRPQLAGLTMVLITVPVFFCPPLSGRLVRAGVSPMRILLASLVCLIVGDATLNLIHPTGMVLTIVVPLFLVGAGMGLSAGLVDGEAIASVPAHKAGMAAGVLNTMRLGSEAVAVAAYGSVLASLMRTEVRDTLPGPAVTAMLRGDLGAALIGTAGAARSDLQGMLTTAYDVAFHQILWILSAICFGLAATTIALLRAGPRGVRGG